jgi:hypothetical protein
MDELLLTESRIMSQVANDNIRLLAQVSAAQTTLENRLDNQMRQFLSTLTANLPTPNTTSDTNPDPQIPVTPNQPYHNSAGALNQGSGQGR